MGKRLNKSGLIVGIGFLGFLMLFGAGGAHAKSSFKNTPLYRHIVRDRSAEPAALYQEKATDPSQKAEVVEKSGDEKAKTAEKNNPAPPVAVAEPKRAGRVLPAQMRPSNLADPSTFRPDMPLSEAVEILRNSTFPKLNIVVLWKDLEENADIYPDTPIGIDGVSGVSLSRHLRSLVDGVSGGSPERLGYVVNDGVVVIATEASLPRRMVTRVYDITDLTAPPSTGFPAFGFGMGMPGMGMMGMGMPGMGMMGGYGGGYGLQGGTLGGGLMGGIVGGLTPGLGGGYGNFGGGYGNFGGGYGSTGLGLGGAPYRPLR